ncbi:MAG TPA: DUF695 domain-containing protein [Planctomycetaceae bacterium]|nr:DUF695 domain-containing protein [Planctomycetaceae bacterium]
MAENWNFYLTNVDGHPASIFVDLGMADAAPDALRPWVLRVAVKMQSAREDGLSDSEEAETLDAIEDALFASVGRGLSARYVGRITTQGHRDHFYYGKSSNGFSVAVEKALTTFPQYKFALADQSDADWDVFFDLLYPGALDMQSIKNRQVIEQLTSNGDDLSQPREVDHWLYFPSEHSREQFTRQIENEGFRVETLANNEPDAEFGFGLHLARHDRVDLESIDALACDLLLRAESCGGEYDGWGCPVVRGE